MTKPLPEEIERTRKRMSDREKIAALRAALSQCQKVLAMLISTPDASVSGISIITAYAQCKSTELIARAALAATEKE